MKYLTFIISLISIFFFSSCATNNQQQPDFQDYLQAFLETREKNILYLDHQVIMRPQIINPANPNQWQEARARQEYFDNFAK